MPSLGAHWAVTGVILSVTTFVVSAFARRRHSLSEPAELRRTIASPRETLLPYLTAAQATALPYPPNIFPGARDVETPFGIMRVYEWGSEDGMKILLVHGDTTPAPMLGPIAEELVSRGCRVMMIDLWGRGYSDTPLDVPHDSRLFAMQLLFATASSPLSWTGTASGGFSIVAFSLGGGIVMAFAAHFYYLINSIVLLAPAGILRRMPDDYESIFFRFSSLVPYTYLRTLVGKLLGVDLSGRSSSLETRQTVDDPRLEIPKRLAPVSKDSLDVGAMVQWQFDYHKGFVHSFIDTILHGPLMNQQSDWHKAAAVIKGKDVATSMQKRSSKLYNSKILVIFGDADSIVAEKEVSEDIAQLLGSPDHVTFKTVPGGHGFPVPSCNEVVNHICEFWEL